MLFAIFELNTLFQFIKRHYRNYGIRRRQLQEEISNLFDLPKSWGGTGLVRKTRHTYPGNELTGTMDPTLSADSVFLLHIYNDLNEDLNDLVRYSKPALDVRKRKSQINRFVSTSKFTMYFYHG